MLTNHIIEKCKIIKNIISLRENYNNWKHILIEVDHICCTRYLNKPSVFDFII